MRISILKEKLKQGINVVERISQKSINLPILQNILLRTEKNFLNLETTNLEIGIKWWSLVKTETEGEIAVPARIFSDLIGFLPNKPILLEKKGVNLEVSCDNYKTKLKGFKTEEFPIIPQLKEDQGQEILIDSFVFSQALSQVIDIVSLSTTRPEISGIYLCFQNDLITITATDSFRLGEKKIFLKLPLDKSYSLILPQQSAKEIINIFGEKKGILKIRFSANQILFEEAMEEVKHPRVQFISRLIEGEYPNYQEIIPKKHETKITLDRNDFLNQVKSASIFSGKISQVDLKVLPKDSQIKISSQSSELGEYQSSLTGKIEGQEIFISFNYRFLIDGLVKIKSPKVLFELTSQEGPAVLKAADSEDYLYVIMPIKIT